MCRSSVFSSLAGLCVLAAGLAAPWAPPAFAQDLTPKAAPQSQPIVIRNATIHPVSGPTIPRGSIVFENGVITDIMSDTEGRALAVPAGAKEIDASNRHVYPGLFTPYTQLGLTEIQAVAATQDFSETGGVTPEVKAATAVNPDSTLLPVTRRNGVLLAGVFPSGGLIAGQPSVMRMDGWTNPDMTALESAGIVLRWPNVRPITAWWMDRSEEDQLREIRRELDDIARVFDTALAYARQRAAEPDSRVDLRWEAMTPLFTMALIKESGMEDRARIKAPAPLFILAQDVDQIQSAVTFALERHLRPVIIGGRDAELCAPLLTRHDVPVILMGVQNMPRRDDSAYDEPFTLAKRLRDAGVRFAICTNDDTAHERNLPYTAATAVAFGLPEADAIRAITLRPAEILGVADRYGSLEKGKSATLIITTGSPLEVTSDVTMAFIDGREVSLRTKQTDLAEKYVEKYRQKGEWKPLPGRR